MTPVLAQALQAITDRMNLATGLMLPKDIGIAKEMLLRLRCAGEELPVREIKLWVISHGWHHEDVKALDVLVKRTRAGRRNPKIRSNWWPDDIVSQFRAKEKS